MREVSEVAEDAPIPSSSQPSAEAAHGSTSPRSLMQDAADAFAIGRAMLAAGRNDDARTLLRALTVKAPAFEAAWLQLLSLDPPLSEEVELLEGFLQHHPEHRFAQAFRARLHDRRIVLMLHEAESPIVQPVPEQAPPSMRLGDFLIKKNWVTPEQIEHALEEQRRLRDAGFEQRLGTILLMQGHLQLEQLAAALGASLATGFGEFGDYLVRSRVLTRDQVAMALARQSALRAENDQEYLEELTNYRHNWRKGASRIGKMITIGQPERKPVPKLGEVMVEMGLLSEDQVEAILEERRKTYNSLFE